MDPAAESPTCRTLAPDEAAATPARSLWRRLCQHEELNFLLTNRLPRQLATRAMGRISRVPTGPLTRLTIALWRLFDPDLDLSEAKQRRFRSLHDCFVRELRPGARPIAEDPRVLTSPCDAIVGAHGRVQGTTAFQLKGAPYSLHDLFGDEELVARHRDGVFVTLRLKSSFYHRLHAPYDAALRRVVYVSGDTWNVNTAALRRIAGLFCKNERAVLDLELAFGRGHVAMVAVAAILVASIRLHAIGPRLDLRYRGPNHIPCVARYGKGDELGWFEHGSTVLLFGEPGATLRADLAEGARVRVGEPLLHLPDVGDRTATDAGRRQEPLRPDTAP